MSQKTPTETPFASTDIYLVAALNASGLPHDYTENNAGRITFYWTNPDVRNQVKDYYSGRLEIKAIDYSQAIKVLKTILHNPID